LYYIFLFSFHNKINSNKINFNFVINNCLPPSRVRSLIRNNCKRDLNYSINKLHLHHYSTKASNIDNNKPILINSKEIINNYEDVKLPIEVLNSKYSFSPWFIIGFVEAEGNFDISLSSNPRILPKFRFRITSKYLDIVLLCALKNYFGSGSIFLRKDTQVFTLEISSQKVINNKIIPLFDLYPLKGTKFYDYINWRDGFKDFLLNKDLESRASLIKRINERKLNLNRMKQEIKLPTEHLNNFNAYYISGFVSGDGSFSVVTGPNSFHSGFGQTVFLITQHINNKLLLEHIMKYLNIGYLGFSKTRPNEINYKVSRKEDLIKYIIPFFEIYPTLGIHSISFIKWKNIINYILESKENTKRESRKIYNSTILIPNIRSYWLYNHNYFINNDLSINKEELKSIK